MVSTAILLMILACILPLPDLPDDELEEPEFLEFQAPPDQRIVRWWLRK